MGQWVGEPAEQEPAEQELEEQEPAEWVLAERAAAVQLVGVCQNSRFADLRRPYYQNTFLLVRIVRTDD